MNEQERKPGETLSDYRLRLGMKCKVCGRDMKPQVDSFTGKLSGFIWSCECTPGISLMIA